MKSGIAVMFAVLALGASACGSDSPSAEAEGSGGAAESSTTDMGDRMIIEPIEAIGGTKVKIESDTVRANFEGSVDDVTATTPCLAVESVIGEKAAILIYEDGEVICAERNAE